MIDQRVLINSLENGLNANSLGKVFKIFSDVADYQNYIKTGNTQIKFINTIFTKISANIYPFKGLQVASYSAQVTIAIDIESAEKDSDGNYPEVYNVRKVVEEYIQAVNGQVITLVDGDITYSTSVGYTLPITGIEMELSPIGRMIPIQFMVEYRFVENGDNSNSDDFYIDGEEIYYNTLSVSRTKMIDTVQKRGDSSVKTLIQTKQLSFEFGIPMLSNTICGAIAEDIAVGNLNAHCLTWRTHNKDYNYITIFGNETLALELNKNKAAVLAVLEADVDVAYFDSDHWTSQEVTVEAGESVELPQGYSEFDVIFWGDETSTRISDETVTSQRTHIYSTAGTYVIRRYMNYKTEYELTLPTGVIVTRNGTSLSDGATIYGNDELVVSFTPYYAVTVNGNSWVSGESYTVTGDVVISSEVVEFSFTSSSYATVTRDGETITTGAILNYGDELTITFDSNASVIKVNDEEWISGEIYTVIGDVTITRTRREYILTYAISELYTHASIKRRGIPLTNGAVIYYGDALVIRGDSSYYIKSIKVNGTTVTSVCGEIIEYTLSVSGNENVQMINVEGIC